MGLDIGCVVRTTNNEVLNNLLAKHFEYVEPLGGYEIFYFRSQWNVKNDIFGLCIGWKQDNHNLTIKEIDKMMSLFMSYTKNNWEDGGHSRWEFEEAKPYLKQYIRNLKTLKIIMNRYDLDVYFYDSY